MVDVCRVALGGRLGRAASLTVGDQTDRRATCQSFDPCSRPPARTGNLALQGRFVSFLCAVAQLRSQRVTAPEDIELGSRLRRVVTRLRATDRRMHEHSRADSHP
jgi:hypothetical protein